MRARLAMMVLAGIALFAARAGAGGSAPSTAEEVTASPPGGVDSSSAFAEYSELEHLADDLTELWRTRPDLFAAVDEVRDEVVAYHRGGAWRPMNVAGLLDGVGEQRLLPLLWALASDDPLALGMGLTAWVAWRVGLTESIGRLRDPRSVPVLQSIVAGDDPQAAVRRAAVAAIGRTGDAGGIAAAIEVAEASPQRRAAVIEGLGQARRAVAADYLLEISRTEDDPVLRRAAIRALGDWGNLEAWRTPALSPWAEEGEAAREIIVETLVDAYPDADSVIRAEIAKTLQLVDVHGSAARAGRRAGVAEDEARGAAWRELQATMQRSPLGSRQDLDR